MTKRKKRKRSPPSPRSRGKDGLTGRQRMFIAEYLVTHNASDAARKAGYTQKNAGVVGPRLLGNVRVAAAIEAAEAERFKRLQMSGDEILAELAHLGRSRLTRYLTYDRRGRLTFTPSADLADGEAAALKKVKRTKRTTITKSGDKIVEVTLELGLHDKVAPLKLLGQAGGVLKEQADVPPAADLEARDSVARKLAQLASRRADEVSGEPDGAGSPGA